VTTTTDEECVNNGAAEDTRDVHTLRGLAIMYAAWRFGDQMTHIPLSWPMHLPSGAGASPRLINIRWWWLIFYATCVVPCVNKSVTHSAASCQRSVTGVKLFVDLLTLRLPSRDPTVFHTMGTSLLSIRFPFLFSFPLRHYLSLSPPLSMSPVALPISSHLMRLKDLGSNVSFPAGPDRTRPTNAFWCIRG